MDADVCECTRSVRKPTEGLLCAEHVLGIGRLSEPPLCGEALLRGDAELTVALRGGKQRANQENKQPEPRPRVGRRPRVPGTFQRPAWLAGLSGGHSTLRARGPLRPWTGA